MASSPAELIEIFNRSVPEKFLQHVIKCLFNVYKEAYDDCDINYSSTEAHDLLPYMRRAKFESRLHELATGSGLRATSQLNKARNSHHTTVLADNIALTSSYVPSPFSLVRHAEFRMGYAKLNQLHLFKKDCVDPNATLYAILLHGDDGVNKNLPAFAHIQFPAADCGSYIGNGINLFNKYEGLVATLRPSVTEEFIHDTAQPVLRDNLVKREIQNK